MMMHTPQYDLDMFNGEASWYAASSDKYAAVHLYVKTPGVPRKTQVFIKMTREQLIGLHRAITDAVDHPVANTRFYIGNKTIGELDRKNCGGGNRLVEDE